jgi:transposase
MTPQERKKQNNDQIRKLIVSKFQEGCSVLNISNQLNMNYRTVATILRVYKTTGRIELIKKRAEKQRKINESAKILIFNKVREYCSITLKQLKEYLANEFYINVSLSTISRQLKHLQFSFKRFS